MRNIVSQWVVGKIIEMGRKLNGRLSGQKRVQSVGSVHDDGGRIKIINTLLGRKAIFMVVFCVIIVVHVA